ncbi:hypothetical protein [Moorena sp. SIO4G3]|uniref:hypothetical protein n=1 Tax=Moorena sp. SIO4G3 TaxID=2607821 RepID=UPI0025FA414D|nr:hypothetical protein [Moorena sp. SIO4G3]
MLNNGMILMEMGSVVLSWLIPIPVPLLGGVRGGFRFPIPDSRFPLLYQKPYIKPKDYHE